MQNAEQKASRLLTPTVTLLAASAGLAAYQLRSVGASSGPFLACLSAVPAILGILFFTASALRSLDADVRVGFYKFAELHQASSADRASFLRQCIRYEVLGDYWTEWTARKKKGSLMQARAWFSRGVLCLVLALGAGGVTQLLVRKDVAKPSATNQTAAPAEAALRPPAAADQPDAESVLAVLINLHIGIVNGAVQNEDDDPSRLLGRFNGYTSRASADAPGGDVFGNRYSVERGLVIEVFPSRADADRRSTYIQELLRNCPFLVSEYHFRSYDGRVLVRVAKHVGQTAVTGIGQAIGQL
ncbi:hypothetical protein [Micromonospora violae]|uniref:hypothetical protein n=1 Tax=Micromonospora violae TaxID=1278207 RepID=UPI0033C6D05A